MAINIVGVNKHRRCFRKKFFVFRKNCGMAGKIFLIPKWYTDLKFFWRRGVGEGGRRKKILSRGPKVAEKGPRHKICLRAPCSSVTLVQLNRRNPADHHSPCRARDPGPDHHKFNKKVQVRKKNMGKNTVSVMESVLPILFY